MTPLSTVAQDAMDAYYGGYAPRDGYFDIDDFKRYVVEVYKALLNAEFDQQRQMSKREIGFNSVEISPDWLVSEKLPVQRKGNDMYVDLSQNIFTFKWDQYSNGLQEVRIIKCKEGNGAIAVKETYKTTKFIPAAPITKVYFYAVKGCNRILFKNRYPQEVEPLYIPDLDENNDNSMMSTSKVYDVIVATCKFMVGIREGQLVQMSNDSNPNKILPKEVNTKNLQ